MGDRNMACKGEFAGGTTGKEDAGFHWRDGRTGSFAQNTDKRKAIIVGVTEKARDLADVLYASKHPSYEVLGFLAEEDDDVPVDMNVIGKASQMFDVAEKCGADEIIVASIPGWQERLAQGIITNGNGHPKIRLVPSVYDAMICYPKLAKINDMPVMTLNYDKPGYHWVIKRTADVIFSLFALVVSLPVIAIAALLMKMTSCGPVLYKQARVGYGGKEFILLKLRTMVENAERDTGPTLSSPTDERVTVIGRILRRLKIDELPQFFNVLKGEMSIVGPRPERRCFVERFCEEIPGYDARHQIKPGITGMAQVRGGYTTDPAVKLKYDLMYVYGGTLWTDLKILAMTIPVTIAGK